MRILFCILLWLIATVCSYSQQQEKKLAERLMDKPDRNMVNSMNGKKFEGNGGSFNLDKKVEQNSFVANKKMETEKFGLKSFFGVKNPWFGNKVYSTDNADMWSKSQVSNSDKKFGVKQNDVKKFQDSEKGLGFGNGVVPVKQATVKGSAEGAVTQMKKELTIDDVREILNKNH